MDTAPDPFTMAFHLRRDLLRDGWNDRSIKQMLVSGLWIRPRRGVYVDAAAWRALDSVGRHVVLTRAVVRQANTGVTVSHTSGVPFWGGPTWGLDLSNVHTTRDDGKPGRKEAGVHQHAGDMVEDDFVIQHGQRVAAPARNALEISMIARTEVALGVMCNYLNRGLTTPEAVRARYELGMTNWPKTGATDVVIRLADPRLQSLLEVRFFYFCFKIGLPAPIPQYEVHTPDGHLVAALDFAWPDLGAYIETNGKAKYQQLLKPHQRPGDVIARERRREELVHRYTGLRGLHVGWDDLESPVLTERRVRDHLWPD